MTLSLEELRSAVAGDGVGVRTRTELEPLGGPGDKIFPPTYGDGGDPETKYAVEKRRIDGADVDCVVLDSVASQANRMESALLDAVRRNEAQLPIISVDFRDTPISYLERISSLEAPHRVFDALLRDSLDGGVLFRLGDAGRRITEATHRNAAALFHFAPTTLLFGGWDSTGPKGGLGAKYERCITSEVVGIGAARGVKTASRIDPAGIQLKAGPVYEGNDAEWTVNEAEARIDKGKPVPYAGGGEGKAGRPSQINHGNVTPTIDRQAGGVTVDRVEATVVLSFLALRKLRFPTDLNGTIVDDSERNSRETAARTVLAVLGLYATALAFEEGFDLRSRCVLAPTGPLSFELLRRNGEREVFTMTADESAGLLRDSVEAAGNSGLSWRDDELLLAPTDRLVELIRKSHDLAATSAAEEQE